MAKLREQEKSVRTVRLELTTEGHLPGGLDFTTRGTLRVLRAAQGAAAPGDVAAVETVIDYTFADGLTGHMESVKTADGVLIFERNPTFGEVFVRMDKALVADLEWAGKVLQRSDVPGQVDERASAPLGSAMVADLAQRYELVELSHKDRKGQAGIWFGGDRRPGPGLEGEDPDVPIADHVELFVREGDQVLLEVVYLQQGQVVQRISVDNLVLDQPMPLESFTLDRKGKRPLDVKDHDPMWQQIEQVLQKAEEKAGGELPPSKR